MEKMKFVLLEDARRAVLNANSKFVWCIDNLPVFTLGKNVEMVVRCKDCKLLSSNEIAKAYNAEKFCMRTGIVACDDDFCSYGERKDNGSCI